MKMDESPEISAEGGGLEQRYAYYRRCQVVRGRRGQCKAPAMRAQQVCYKHAAMQELAARREKQKKAVLKKVMEKRGLTKPEEAFGGRRALLATISEVVQAICDDSLDHGAAKEMLANVEVATTMFAGRKPRVGVWPPRKPRW